MNYRERVINLLREEFKGQFERVVKVADADWFNRYIEASEKAGESACTTAEHLTLEIIYQQ